MCKFMCVRNCMYIHIYVMNIRYIYKYIQYTHIYQYAYISYVHKYTCIYTRIRALRVHAYKSYVQIYIYTYTYILYVCTYTYNACCIYIYIHDVSYIHAYLCMYIYLYIKKFCGRQGSQNIKYQNF